ncbi:hypothetical protein DM02DRAFT_612606 [Periconia macrospinosa]|uniref:Dienelactone hydrolase domain-containing protein n=1 Tax=Periconia macrospinosa TaxID=97972 RepID=A0A2V1E0H0_9PLEO|nr:hypothetical protein DM02DRAFT_612606 [Periconia macrospinosa]
MGISLTQKRSAYSENTRALHHPKISPLPDYPIPVSTMSSSENCACITGTIHSGQPSGTYSTTHTLKTYITGNPATARALVILYTDIFGLALPNNLLLADGIATQGNFLVYVPDFFQGDPVKLALADLLIPVDEKKQSTFGKYTGLLANSIDFLKWTRRHKAKETDELCMKYLGDIRREFSNKDGKEWKIGMVGYCWGGRYTLRAAREENKIEVQGKKVPLIDAAVAQHPSNLVLPEDARGLVVPVSVGWGEHDSMISLAVKEAFEKTCKAEVKDGGTEVETENVLWSPGRHGFAVRGNPDDKEERAILEGTERQTVKWFEKFLTT